MSLTRIQELLAVSQHKGQKEYYFFLSGNNIGANQKLRYAPDGFIDSSYSITRNERWHGLFRTVSIETLIFVKDGRDLLQTEYEASGINAGVTLTVMRLDKSTMTYYEYYKGVVDFSTYRITETGVEVQIIDKTFAEKIKTRANIDVDIVQKTSVEGYSIPAWLNEVQRLNLPETTIKYNANWIRGSSFNSAVLVHYLPLSFQLSDFDTCQSQSISGTDKMIDPLVQVGTETTRDFDIRGTIAGTVTAAGTASEIQIEIFLKEVSSSTVIATWSDVVANNDTLDFDIDLDTSVTLNVGESYYMYAEISVVLSTLQLCTYSTCEVQFEEEFLSLDDSIINAYAIYEAFLRTCQVIGDGYDVFKSTYFGRTDTPIRTYASDGELGHITRGYWIRRQTTYNNTFPVSLNYLFDNISKIYNVGMGIEDGFVVVEDLQYFYDSEVVLDLSDRIREAIIEKEVMPELHYNQVNTGYDSFTYQEIGGLKEFNTKQGYSTELRNVDNELDLVSAIRGDTSGINLLREIARSAEDEDGDEDFFVIDAVRDNGDFLARTSENLDYATGGVDADQYFNLRLTPARNLFRSGVKLRAGMLRNDTMTVRWQRNEKNTTLVTKFLGEDEVVENADIRADELEESFFYPELYKVTAPFYREDLDTLETNPKGLIKISETKYGWIKKITIKNRSNKADLELIRANYSVLTP